MNSVSAADTAMAVHSVLFESATDIMDTFERSGPHFPERNWPTDSYCVFKCTLEKLPRSFIFTDNQDGHAEEQAVNFLAKNIKSLKPQKIRFYLNWSPCARCSSLFLNFSRMITEKKLSIDLEIVFRGLYEISRPSCKGLPCDCAVRKPEHVQKLHALWRCEHVTVRTFIEEDWKTLVQLLHNNAATKHDDALLRRDFEQLMTEQENKKRDEKKNKN
ncbi:uncharacterized protein LOC106167175 [Lingula anatina]|uniref:Uncharacterized protein LOC106167175 n=1 Tax=Lingula anatina TaxID=7574 RepID=A0A1S3ITD1_LINAN|nr:uncharacterized protein LOC106167175 [Lingula anatina]|eukprot:XP_013401343.1 uncharacterized protein LOC106167175 [Lingula anatina]